MILPLSVSIHAPAWGATKDWLREIDCRKDVSIHAPAWGATLTRQALVPLFLFQSTRPRGARRAKIKESVWVVLSFNPRARVGRDYTPFYHHPYNKAVSIHAPAWGAT